MKEPPPPILSDELTPLIERAVDLGYAGMRLIDELRSENETGVTFPEATVVRLHLVAASTFLSGLVCLRIPETSLAAYTLIRCLLEVWSHITFISDDSKGGDVRCRALRYERGALQEWVSSGQKAPPYFDSVSWNARNDDRLRDIDQLWTECNCSGQPRTRKHVYSTLKSMAAQAGMEWIPGVWSASSAATHAYGVDFLLDGRDDETRLVWALPSQRASWLGLLVSSYAYATVTGSTILAGAEQRISTFRTEAESLVDELSHRLTCGAFDR